MRLVCPNCAAQYEVDAAVIPDDGREVVCSACGHAWFQPSQRQIDAGMTPTPTAAAQPAVSQEDAVAAEAETAAATDTGSDETPPDLPAAETAAHPDVDPDTPGSVESTQAPDADLAAPPRRTLDDAMMAVLREEAEREARARRDEGTSLEMQPDLGLDTAAAPAAAAGSDAAPAPSWDQSVPAAAVVPPTNRRALLPDIEVINSTLTATSDRDDMADGISPADRQRRARSGFRAGFMLALLAALGLLGLYLLAPSVAARWPAAAPALDSFVTGIDSGRLWLDGLMRRSTDALRGAQGGGT